MRISVRYRLPTLTKRDQKKAAYFLCILYHLQSTFIGHVLLNPCKIPLGIFIPRFIDEEDKVRYLGVVG